MSHFQLASHADRGTYKELEECLASIVAKGVRITSAERLSKTLPLIGLNVSIECVSPRIERRWQRIIARVVKHSSRAISHRFRFSDWSY